jgi:hypothetical protein
MTLSTTLYKTLVCISCTWVQGSCGVRLAKRMEDSNVDMNDHQDSTQENHGNHQNHPVEGNKHQQNQQNQEAHMADSLDGQQRLSDLWWQGIINEENLKNNSVNQMDEGDQIESEQEELVEPTWLMKFVGDHDGCDSLVKDSDAQGVSQQSDVGINFKEQPLVYRIQLPVGWFAYYDKTTGQPMKQSIMGLLCSNTSTKFHRASVLRTHHNAVEIFQEAMGRNAVFAAEYFFPGMSLDRAQSDLFSVSYNLFGVSPE